MPEVPKTPPPGFLARALGHDLEVHEKIEIRRSRVRTMVTHSATLFLFLGGALLIAYLVVTGNGDPTNGRVDKAIDLFQAVLPVAASIISFWFAGRTSDQKPGND